MYGINVYDTSSMLCIINRKGVYKLVNRVETHQHTSVLHFAKQTEEIDLAVLKWATETPETQKLHVKADEKFCYKTA